MDRERMAILALALLANKISAPLLISTVKQGGMTILVQEGFFYWKRLSITEEQMNSQSVSEKCTDRILKHLSVIVKTSKLSQATWQ